MADRVTQYLSFSKENWLWATFIFAVTVVLLPLFLLSLLPQPKLEASVLIVFVSVLYSGTHLASLALKGSEALLNLTFWLFAYVWLGITPLLQLAAGDFPWPGMYSEYTLVYAAFIVLIGYVSYDLGVWLGNRNSRRSIGRSVPIRFSFSKRRIYLLAPLALALTLIATVELGGVQLLFTARNTVNEEVSSEFGIAGSTTWFSLLRWPSLISLLLTIWAWFNQRHLGIFGWERFMLGILIIVMASVAFVANNPISNPRLRVGMMIFVLVFLLIKWNSRRSMGTLIIGLMGALLLIFPYADLFRRENSTLTFTTVTEQLVFNGDYDVFQQLASTLRYVSAEGLTFGWQSVGMLLFWVPRELWPSKPVGTGTLVAEYSGRSFTTVPSPLWGQAYIDGAIIGVVLIFLAYGVFTAFLQKRYLEQNRLSLSVVSLLVPLFAAYQIYFIRGDMIATFAYIMPGLAYMMLAVKRLPSLKKSGSEPVDYERRTSRTRARYTVRASRTRRREFRGS